MKSVILYYFNIIGYILFVIPSTNPRPNISSLCIFRFDCIQIQTKTVHCTNLNLTSIPNCFEDVKILDLSGNFLQYLEKENFPSNLSSVNTLILHNSNVKLLADDTFDNLVNLQKLDLSMNYLKFFQPKILQNHVRLETLNLSSNLMKKLLPNQFLSPNLRILDLSSCFIEFIDESAFKKASNLEWLNLRDNKLKVLPTVSIHTLLLGGSNLWECNCKFYRMAQNRTAEAKENDENFTCVDFEQIRIAWNELRLIGNECDEDKSTSLTGKIEKLPKAENSPDLILDVYGYVLMILTILIFLCCCCDGRNRRPPPQSHQRQEYSPGLSVHVNPLWTDEDKHVIEADNDTTTVDVNPTTDTPETQLKSL